MSNDRLRDALMTARITHEDLATELEVNTKTVERWVSQGRLPHPQFRHRISVLVQKDERWLWPDGYSRKRRAEIAESEIVRIYPYRADVPDDLWARLFENAIDNIGILVYSGFFLAEQHARKMELLKKKADDGASIRILIGDPDCPQVALRGQEEDIGDAIAAKIRNVLLAYYAPYADHPGSGSGCTPPRCTTRSTGSTTTCWSTPTPTACPRTSPRSCTCAISAPEPCSRPTPAASTGYGTRPARPGPARR